VQRLRRTAGQLPSAGPPAARPLLVGAGGVLGHRVRDSTLDCVQVCQRRGNRFGVGWEQRGAGGAGRTSSACALYIERTPDRTADPGRAWTCTTGNRAGRGGRLGRRTLLGRHGRAPRNRCIRDDRTGRRRPLAGDDGLAWHRGGAYLPQSDFLTALERIRSLVGAWPLVHAIRGRTPDQTECRSDGGADSLERKKLKFLGCGTAKATDS